MIRVLDLFSGIGGFSYGLKQAGGFQTVAYCEIEEYPREILLHRMEEGQLDPAPIHTDITQLDGRPLRGHVDLICGGFPCQDLSTAGRQAGIDGSRSGLWGEYARLIREIRPRWVIVENVPNLLVLGMHRVLGDLASSGYDAEWSCISAAEMGAPHRRDRVWIIGENVADPGSSRQPGPGKPGDASHTEKGSEGETTQPGNGRFRPVWSPEPNVGRVANGIPFRMDKLKGLGNAIVPQVATLLGKRIMEVESLSPQVTCRLTDRLDPGEVCPLREGAHP